MSSEAREAMIDGIWLRDGQHRDHREAQVDVIIRDLWSRADDPDVVKASAAAMYGRGHDPSTYFPYDVQPLEVREHYERLATLTLAAGLTALLGPRPTEQAARKDSAMRGTKG